MAGGIIKPDLETKVNAPEKTDLMAFLAKSA